MNGIAFAQAQTPTASLNTGSVAFVDRTLASVSATLLPVSLLWDYSWESSIGVDLVWSPPHVVTHAAVWVAAIVGLRLLAVFTFGNWQCRPVAGVKLGPVSAPAGAWVMLWGVGLFEWVFPLDVWWQQAYGLGAGIWPPPQILKAASFVVLEFGALMLVTSRAEGSSRAWSIWICGAMLSLASVFFGTVTLPNLQHGASFFKLSAVVFPALLAVATVLGRSRWSATFAALAYLLINCSMLWVLPLFPAQPQAAPIHNPLAHFIAPQFPLLLIIPALALDLLRRVLGETRSVWREVMFALAAGAVFVAVYVPTQWLFAEFLLSPRADNPFFAGGGKHWPFFLKIDSARTAFWSDSQSTMKWAMIPVTVMFAAISAWFGARIGRFLESLR